MANASVAFDGTRVDNADALGSIWTDLAGGKAASEPDFIYQGTAAVSEKVGTSEGGVALDMVATTDYTVGADRVWLAKIICTNSSALNNKGSTGAILEIGSGGRRSAYDRYYVAGGDTWPVNLSWLVFAIDPNGGNQSARPGTAPTLTAIDYYGLAAAFGSTSKAENVAMDSVDWITNGTGLTLTDGIGGTDGDFALFATTDFGTSTNRWGVCQSRDGILFVTGVLTVGDSGTGAEFTSTGEVVVWPDQEFLNALGFFGLDLNLQNASTVISITNGTFISRGTAGGTVDTRAVFEVIGTSGTATLDGCNFQNLADFILTSGATVTSCGIETAAMTQGSADISDCTITTTAAASVATLTDPTFGTTTDLHDCEFVQGGAGHAIEIPTVGNYTLTNLTFTGYSASNNNDASMLDLTATSGTYNLTISGGTNPSYRTAGATVNIILSPVDVTINVKDENNGNLQNARVLLEAADGAGDYPYQDTVTITRSGSTASVSHTAHGLQDGDKVAIRGAVEQEYNGVFTITNTTTNAYDYTVSGTPGTPATGTITSTGVVLAGLTNASGQITASKPFSVNQNVRGFVRKATTSPLYKSVSFTDTINSSTGLTKTQQMVRDD